MRTLDERPDPASADQGEVSKYRWFIDYAPDLPGVFVDRSNVLTLALAELTCGVILALPPVASGLGISPVHGFGIALGHFLTLLIASGLFRERAKTSPAAFYVAASMNLIAGVAASCAIPVLSGDPRSFGWALPIVYAVVNAGLPETRPSYGVLLVHTAGPIATIPFFDLPEGARWDAWQLGGPVLAAGVSAGLYHYVAMRTAEWRALRTQHQRALLKLREQEEKLARARLAQDLHDSVGSTLSLLSLHAELLEKNGGDAKRAAQLAQLAREAARAGLHDLRGVLDAIAPEDEPLSSLIDSLRELARVTAPGVDVEIELRSKNEMDRGGSGSVARAPRDAAIGLELHVKERLLILRIFQESLRNAVVHGGAKSFSFLIDLRNGLELHVRDDGRGFDPERIVPGRGLSGMRTRIEELGGRFSLQSQPGQGTALRARLG